MAATFVQPNPSATLHAHDRKLQSMNQSQVGPDARAILQADNWWGKWTVPLGEVIYFFMGPGTVIVPRTQDFGNGCLYALKAETKACHRERPKKMTGHACISRCFLRWHRHERVHTGYKRIAGA